tara:strand:+ start:196 stop:390 length:195 start_codon:yes stop_codon:yes gene_type:complete
LKSLQRIIVQDADLVNIAQFQDIKEMRLGQIDNGVVLKIWIKGKTRNVLGKSDNHSSIAALCAL